MKNSALLATVTFVPVFCFSSLTTAGVVVPQQRMGDPLPGLTADQLHRFQVGQSLYNTPLTIGQGLGPCFNKASCGNCHSNPLGGTGSITVTRFGHWDKGVFDPLAELGGSLLQSSAISGTCLEHVPEAAETTSLRVTNGALAYGLVEAIDDEDILAVRDAQPANVQGIATVVYPFEDPKSSHVGRFGWKAQVATVLTFSADASLNELGLTNEFVTTENAPNGDQRLLAFCDTVGDPEDVQDGEGYFLIERFTDFQRFLGHAPQTPKSGMSGEVVFNNLGCAVCHHSSFTTPDVNTLEDALRNKTIRPYSDWLLHDMGENADFIEQGAGTAQLLKTPPLWGLKVRDPMWHDGRAGGGTFADRIDQVIQLHGAPGSQGIDAVNAYLAASAQDKADLVNFLGSLGQMEFDADGNGNIYLSDFVAFHGCYTGSGGGPVSADAPCAIHDIDQDGDIDLDDFASFMSVYVGPRRDCNNNGILDLQEILEGGLADANANGFADSCEPTCDADVTGNAVIDVDDLFTVINTWGACPGGLSPCAGDADYNNVVDIDDLFYIINSWGPCP